MKITANRRDEILQQRAEYDAKIKGLRDREEEMMNTYHTAVRDRKRELEQHISDLIGPTPLQLEIRVESDFHWKRDAGDRYFWKIYIRANEYNKFDANVALSWNIDIGLDSDGNVKKDSSSWSGLKAVTPEQVADLEESVRIIKLINNIDWNEIVHAPNVSYDDYIDKNVSSERYQLEKARPQFEEDLRALGLDDFINTNKAIRIKDSHEDAQWRGRVYILVTGYTDKFVRGYVFPEHFVDSYLNYTVDEIESRVDQRRIVRTALALDETGDTYDFIEVPTVREEAVPEV